MADRMSEIDDQKAEQRRDAREEMGGQVATAPAAVTKHIWTKDDTYSGLAQKYYGSSQEPYWRLIYERNKAIIGDHPNAIRVGMEIVIPPLPDELKE